MKIKKYNRGIAPTPISVLCCLTKLKLSSGIKFIICCFDKRVRDKQHKMIPRLVSGFTPTPTLVSHCFIRNVSFLDLYFFCHPFTSKVNIRQCKTTPRLVSGFSLVEILVAVFIFSTILSALILSSNMYFSRARENLKMAKAAYLAEEGIEAVKIIRDTDWTNISSLSNNTDYYLYFDGVLNTWKATTTLNGVDSFIRSFVLNEVSRDSNGRITSSGGDVDSKTKKLTVSVSWPTSSGTTSRSVSTYITDIFGN